MSYSESLAERARRILSRRSGVVEKKMFGGLAFMLNNAMCCGVVGNDLVARIGPERCKHALGEPHVRAMDFTGKPMKGYVYVGPGGYASAEDLERWIEWAAEFVSTPPAPGSPGG